MELGASTYYWSADHFSEATAELIRGLGWALGRVSQLHFEGALDLDEFRAAVAELERWAGQVDPDKVESAAGRSSDDVYRDFAENVELCAGERDLETFALVVARDVRLGFAAEPLMNLEELLHPEHGTAGREHLRAELGDKRGGMAALRKLVRDPEQHRDTRLQAVQCLRNLDARDAPARKERRERWTERAPERQA